MYWTDIDHSFCESSITGLPEYYNSISSIFIILFGLYGIKSIYNELFVDILYSNLIIVGFGSFGYHWYGNIGWGLFDEIPMILAIFTGIIYVDNVHYLISKSTKNTIVSLIELNYKKKFKTLVYLFAMSYITIINVMSNYRRLFPTIFGCVAAYLYYKIFVVLRLLNPEIKEKVLDKAYYSLITIAISGTVWVSTELTCNYVKSAILLIGHPMWHFFIGHGFYNLIQVVYFIKLNNTKYELKYNSLYLLKRDPELVDFL